MATVKTYSIGGVVGIAIGLVATAIQWKYPEHKGAANVLLVVAGLLIFGAIVAFIVRKQTMKEYERLHPAIATTPAPQITQTANPHNEFKPHNVFKPTVKVSVPVTQNQIQKQSQRQSQTPKALSVFDATDNTRIEPYGFDNRT